MKCDERWLTVVLMTAAVGCGDGDSASKAETPAAVAEAKATYSIKAYAKVGDSVELVEFSPEKRGVMDAETAEDSESAQQSAMDAASAAMAVYDEGDETYETALEEEGADISLGYYALEECFKPEPVGYVRDSDLGDWTLSKHPWVVLGPAGSYFYASWHYFETDGSFSLLTCDEQLYAQDALLCAAGKLNEIAEAVAPVEFTNLTPPLVFPPQATRDRFVARDMALNMLAHIGRIEGEWVDLGSQWRPACPERWDQIAQGEIEDWDTVFSVVDGETRFLAFDGNTDPPDDGTAPGLAAKRATYHAHILRSAARMVRDIMVKSVAEDAAGAEKQRADAGDPALGLWRMWGVSRELNAGYSSLSHGLHTLFGRLELGVSDGGSYGIPAPGAPSSSDPRCGGYYSFYSLVTPAAYPTEEEEEQEEGEPTSNGSSLVHAMSPSASALWSELPPASAEQASLANAIEAAGIIVPAATLDAWSANPELADAVQAQLVLNAAMAQRDSDSALDEGALLADYEETAAGRAALETADSAQSEDMLYALRRNLYTVELAFDLEPGLNLTALEDVLGNTAHLPLRDSGASDDNGVTPGLEDAALIASEGLGAVRRGLAVPGAARTLGPRAATQCGMQPMWFPNDSSKLHPQLASFQSGFGLARVLMESLTSERKRLEAAPDNDLLAETRDIVTKAVGELASWGPRIRTTLTIAPDTNDVMVDVMGIVPSDFGVATPEDLTERIVLARGPQWVAQCLAGMRTACPDAAEMAQWVLEPDISWRDANANECFDGLMLQLSASPNYVETTDWGTPVDERYYVIVKGVDGEAGRVIAVLEPRPDPVVDFYSPLRDDLADQLFGIKEASAIPKMCRESSAAGISGNYCVPGVSRDFFVPLANELTSESGGTVEDSWKHYMTLAEQAAARTDELGQEIIETGLQRDFRREAAQEELAEICGSFTAADGIAVTDGRVDTTDSDSEINQCLQTDTYDVVFLGANRFSESSTATEVQAAYCQGTPRPKFCDKPPDQLKIAFLGLPPVTEGEPNVASVCSQVAEAHSALEGNQSAWNDGALTEAMNDGEISPEALQLSAMQLHLVVDQDPNRWSLRTGIQILMERRPDSEVAALDPSLGSEEAGVRVYPLCKQLDPDAWDCDPLDYFEADGTEHDGADARPPCCDGLAATFDRAFGTQGDSIPSALLTSLGHRIESAVWHLGALAGSLPAGAITMPVPVANFSEAGTSGALPDAWAPTLYATGRFTGPSGGEYNIDASSSPEVTTIDTRYLTHLLPMNSDYAASRQDLGPDWSREVFAAATAADGRYLVVPDAASPAIRFNTNMLNGDGDRVSRESMTNWMASTIAALGGDTTNSWTGESNALRAMQTLSGLDLGDESAAESWRHVCAPGAAGFIRDNRYGGYPDVNASTELVLIDKWIVGEGQRPFSAYFPDGDDKKTRPLLSSGWSEGSLVIGQAGCSVVNEPRVTAGCALATGSHVQPFARVRFYAPRVLSAQHCPPGDRVELFVNRSIEDEAQARQALADAFLLGCTARQNTSVGRVDGLPHAIQTEQDLEYFEGWLSAVALEANAMAEQLFVEDVPQVVVADFQQGLVGTDAVGNGTLGQHQLEMGTGFRGMNTGWNHMASSLRQLRNAVQLLRLELAGIRLQGERDELQLAFQKTEQWRQLTIGAIQAAAGTLGAVCAPTETSPTDIIGSIGDAAVGAANVAFSMAQLENLDEQEQVAHEQTQNSVNQAIQSFNQQVEGLNLAYQDAVTMMQDAEAQVLSALNSDRSARNEAAFEAAKASGADFAYVDGEVVALPVNTVLRRQYDILQRRYERALTNAKYLAYMARLAIEQRIGVRMNDLNVEVGALEAPSLWADDVCSLQGIDYDALREREEDSTDGEEGIQIDEFADAYIGDYVEKLRQFVEYYNIDAPFQQADDLVVVSLRDDVLGSAGQCERESRNLLFFSDQLWHGASQAAEDSSAPSDVSLGGWRRAECGLDDTVCLDVTLPEVNQNDEWRVTDMEPPGGIGAVSWLRDRDAEEVRSADQEILETEGATEATDTNGPGRAVYQSVSLRAATDYQLSWWDRALNPADGSAEVSDGEPYQVSVYASDWTVVASETFEPANQDTVGEDGWSERRSMLFTAFEDGTYHVVFRAAVPGATTGSVAIADVQLAELESADMTVAYESTSASRMVVSGGCGKGNPDMMRSAFEYRCEDGRCFYEMKNTFDLGIIAQGSSSPIANRVAVGNFNYRNVSTALNIVGTGVLDCSDGTESCYGNGLVQYDLEHSAHSVGLEDYAGDSWCFNFERAAIRGAKALATERYLTVPMSSADEALIGGDEFSKRELFGRPLSGQYKLRLYDTSSLQWDRVEDIQIAVRYRYWSRVDRAM